jgi:hypothetical protein
MHFNLLEGQLFWGKELYDRRHDLCQLVTRLTVARRECARLDAVDLSDDERSRINGKYFQVCYGSGGAHSDEFATQGREAVKQIEQALEPYIA